MVTSMLILVCDFFLCFGSLISVSSLVYTRSTHSSVCLVSDSCLLDPIRVEAMSESDEENDSPTSYPSQRCSSQEVTKCPLCAVVSKNTGSLLQHINSCHITYRQFPDTNFLESYNRRLCSNCGFAYEKRFSRCRRSLGSGICQCRDEIVAPMLSPWLRDGTSHRCTSESAVDGAEAVDDVEAADGAEAADDTEVASEMQSPCVEKVITDIVLDGIEAATTLGKPHGDEEETLYSVMREIATLPVNTSMHVPSSVRPLLAQVLADEFNHCNSKNGIWGFTRLFMFAKTVLRSPPRGGRSKRCAVKTILNTCLLRWKEGGLCGLWQEAKADARPRKVLSVQHSNSIRALRLAKEGRYGDAMHSLSSQGCASHDNEDALTDLQRRHPDHVLPTWCEELPPPLVADSSTVLSC